MCKVIKFHKVHKETKEISIEEVYEKFYADPSNYEINQDEYKECMDYKIINRKIVSLW